MRRGDGPEVETYVVCKFAKRERVVVWSVYARLKRLTGEFVVANERRGLSERRAFGRSKHSQHSVAFLAFPLVISGVYGL